MNLSKRIFNPEHRKYLFLDGLRAVAMILVMMGHSYDFYWRYVPNYAHITISPIYAFFSGCDQEGVYLFFMLSGFLITGVMINDFSKAIELKKFYIRRFLKIVPLFSIVVVLVYVLSKYLGVYKEYNDALYLVPLFYLQDFFPPHPILSQAWSLTVEMEFYLVYPLIAIAIFTWIKKANERRWLLLRAVLLLASLAVAYRHLHHHFGAPDINVLDYCDGLFLGCALKIMEPYYPKFKKPYQLIFTLACVVTAFLLLKFSGTVVDRKFTLNAWDNPCMHRCCFYPRVFCRLL